MDNLLTYKGEDGLTSIQFYSCLNEMPQPDPLTKEKLLEAISKLDGVPKGFVK